MAPTPALWALLRWTCSPVANRIPSLTAIERCENDAMRSSFQPETETGRAIREKYEKKKNKQIPVQKFTQHSDKMELTTKGEFQWINEALQYKACSFHKQRRRVITKTFESYAFQKDKRVKGMNCGCHHNKDNRLDVPKQGLDTESTENTRRCHLSDRAPLTVLPGNTRLFSPELSWVWEELGCFYLWYSRTKVVIYRKPESWEETSSPE